MGGINQVLLRFILKSGDPKIITNWWPITLLNTSYKILAKVLTLPAEAHST
jgi:hypothetical protein|uniref:Uncharacterized protein n=1 Tax=Picea glauca TaxID=3330 RepID=A0A101M4T4_PICGL|nr:hypothetical protein ABT39_MTgene800 [Picea glauca]